MSEERDPFLTIANEVAFVPYLETQRIGSFLCAIPAFPFLRV